MTWYTVSRRAGELVVKTYNKERASWYMQELSRKGDICVIRKYIDDREMPYPT